MVRKRRSFSISNAFITNNNNSKTNLSIHSFIPARSIDLAIIIIHWIWLCIMLMLIKTFLLSQSSFGAVAIHEDGAAHQIINSHITQCTNANEKVQRLTLMDGLTYHRMGIYMYLWTIFHRSTGRCWGGAVNEDEELSGLSEMKSVSLKLWYYIYRSLLLATITRGKDGWKGGRGMLSLSLSLHVLLSLRCCLVLMWCDMWRANMYQEDRRTGNNGMALGIR